MLKTYLFIELLADADPEAVVADLRALELANGKVQNAVALSEDKVVARIDCRSGPDATRAVLESVASVQGVVQTNVIAVIRPRKS